MGHVSGHLHPDTEFTCQLVHNNNADVNNNRSLNSEW